MHVFYRSIPIFHVQSKAQTGRAELRDGCKHRKKREERKKMMNRCLEIPLFDFFRSFRRYYVNGDKLS